MQVFSGVPVLEVAFQHFSQVNPGELFDAVLRAAKAATILILCQFSVVEVFG